MTSEVSEVGTPIYDQLFAEVWPPEVTEEPAETDPVTATPTAE